jgi:hyperosmotically inducible periplasmic protein
MRGGMSTQRTTSWSLGSALAVTALLGCATSRNAAEGTGDLVISGADEVGTATTDRSITFAVKTAIIRDELVEAGDIDVDTSEGVVTLNGTQPSAAACDRAVELARQAAGVKRVVNNLVVAPSADE